MQNKFARFRVEIHQRVAGARGCAFFLNIRRVDVAQRRFREKFLFRGIDAFEAEEQNIRLANQGRFSPKAHQLRRAEPDDAGHDHAIDAAGRSGSGGIEIGVAVHPEQIEMLVVAARTGEQSNDLRAIAAEDQNQRAALHGGFRVHLQVVQAGDDRGQIAGATMLFIVGKQARRTVAQIRNFIADIFQFFDQARGAQSLRRFFGPRQKGSRAGTGADEGNLLRLTDNFDRQSLSPEVSEIRPALARPAAPARGKKTKLLSPWRKTINAAAPRRWWPAPAAA